LKKFRRKGSLADPTALPPPNKDSRTIQIIIETPKGSRNKYAFDPDLKVFQRKEVLPAGMSFPSDFGFVPSAKAEDGNPLDALALIDAPAFTGCLLRRRPFGVIQGQQGKKKDNATTASSRSNKTITVCPRAGRVLCELPRADRKEL
jgi:inorganic pyrophosphatase